jgi:hypothetical protein
MFKRLLRRRPAPGTIMGGLALFITLGGVGYAATGGNFILGQANTATTPSSLSAPIAGGKALQLTNTSATGGSTALGLTVGAGKAPFTVNSSGKVTNLNADRLDGIDSTEFIAVGGTTTTTSVGMPDCDPGIDYMVRSFTAPRVGSALVNASFTAGVPNVLHVPVAARLERQTDTSLLVGVWQEETLVDNGRANISLSQVFPVVAGTNTLILKVCDSNDYTGSGSAVTIEGQLTILYSRFAL